MKKITIIALCAVLALTTLAACGKKDEVVADVPTADVLADIKEALGEDMPMMGEVDAATLETLYGIKASDVAEFSGMMAMINVRADEIVVFKAKDGKTDDIKAAIEKRKADLDALWSQYLPDVYEQVKNAQIVEKGDYVLFVVLPDAQKAVDAFNTALTVK